MRRNRIGVAVLAALTLLAAPLVGSAPALAADGSSASDIRIIRAGLAKYGVELPTQDRLVRAYLAGEAWDSQAGAEPVATTTRDIDGFKQTIYRYGDGSVAASGVEIPSDTAGGEVGTRGITGCTTITVTGGKGWTGCSVTWDAVTWSVGFRASYRYWLGPSYGCYIDSISALTHGGIGSFSDPNLQYVVRSTPRESASYTRECQAQGNYTQSVTGISQSVGVRLRLSPQHGGGWTTKVGTA